jgi:tetratricopeptide (TPR) repeat protein
MRHVADLLAEDERYDEAKELLNSLFIDHNDVKALIQIGDMYRRQEEYQSALNIYNQAVSHLGEAVPDEYWFVLYGRGMAYEREGQWEQAEADLKAALVYRPNHPYLLNYLGYGWAEQGMQLDKALELIEKAVRLKPRDGYIQDSMGWVLYRMGEFEEAVPYLETAVELLPYDPTINDHLGDAYWMVDRTVEARYQWERAKNHEEDELLLDVIGAKIKYGLDDAIERDLAEDHSLVDSAE